MTGHTNEWNQAQSRTACVTVRCNKTHNNVLTDLAKLKKLLVSPVTMLDEPKITKLCKSLCSAGEN